MKKVKLLVSIFCVTIISCSILDIYAKNANTSSSTVTDSVNPGKSNQSQTQSGQGNNVITQSQNQTQSGTSVGNGLQTQAQINIGGKTSFANKKSEVQAKIALKMSAKDQNTELKNMIRQNNATIISLKQALRNKLVNMVQTLQMYKTLTDLTDAQVKDIDNKAVIVSQVKLVLQTQNQEFKTSISQFRQDSSANKINTLTNIAAAQATRIDILYATIALF